MISPDAGQWQQATASSQPCDHKGKQPINTILVFTFSMQLNYNNITPLLNTLVLDDFA